MAKIGFSIIGYRFCKLQLFSINVALTMVFAVFIFFPGRLEAQDRANLLGCGFKLQSRCIINMPFSYSTIECLLPFAQIPKLRFHSESLNS